MASETPRKTPKGIFPLPLIISPRLEHRQTFIILHGRGSTAEEFGPPLLSTRSSTGKETLQEAFPHAKFIFPTASRSRAAAFNRSLTHQWFDIWDLKEHLHERQELMTRGLKQSTSYVHTLLESEIAVVGQENVVLWGLSQGSATSLISLLTWSGEPFAAVVGMCGWLPFAKLMHEIAREALDDLFEDENDQSPPEPPDGRGYIQLPDLGDKKVQINSLSEQAIRFLLDELELSRKPTLAFQEIPILLCHGREDEKVVLEHGIEAAECLELLEADVRMVEYNGLGHWYSEDMLEDTFRFLRQSLISPGSDI